jgi:hypothetical protein
MPAHKRITGDMVAGMLKLAGSGKSAAEIAAWILAEHKVKVSDRAVRQHLAKVAKDREPLAKAVVQEQLSKTLTADITALDRLLGRAHQVELDAGNPEKLEELDKELARLALSDIEEAVDATGAVKPLAEMPLDVRKAIASVEVEEVRLMDGDVVAGPPPGNETDVDPEEGGKRFVRTTKLKLWDKNKALAELIKLRGKHAERATILAAQEMQRKLLELRFKLVGIGNGEDETTAARKSLLEKLSALEAKRKG